MSLRGPTAGTIPKTPINSQSLSKPICCRRNYIQWRHQVPSHLRASAGKDDNADAATPNGSVAAPDPWLTPAQSLYSSPNDLKITKPSSGSPAPEVASSPSPPSPWDVPTTSAAVASPPVSHEAQTSVTSASPAPSQTIKRGGYDGHTDAASNTTSTSASTGGGGGGGVSGSGSRSGSGVDGTPLNVREASAALSEDTAALLARLRAELARTSSIKMPPRWTSASGRAAAAAAAAAAATAPPAGDTTATGTSAVSAGAAANTTPAAAPAPTVSTGTPAAAGSFVPADEASNSNNNGTGRSRRGGGSESGDGKAAAATTPADVSGGAAAKDGVAGGAAPEAPIPSPQTRTPASAPSVKVREAVLPDRVAAGPDASEDEGAAQAPKQGFGNGFISFLRRRAAGAVDGAASAAAGAATAADAGSAAAAASTSSTTSTSQLPTANRQQPALQAGVDATANSAAPAAAVPAAPAAVEAGGSGSTVAAATAPPVSSSPRSSSSRTAGTSSGAATSTSTSAPASTKTSSSSSSSGAAGSARVGDRGGRRKRAVVVGGGIGGLVSAARLAKEGFSVTLLEANSQVGGRCQSLQRGRFRFDTGPSLLLFIETYRKTFAALGTSLPQQVPVVRVTPAAYRVFFQGAGSLDMLFDVQRMVEQLEAVEKGAGGQYLEWLATARAALELGVEGFIEKDSDSLVELVGRALQDEGLRKLLTSVGVTELLGNHHDRMTKRFRDPRLQAMFTFQDLYVGLSPYTAPGVYSLLAATEVTDGVWYPLGGFGQIRDALLRVGQSLGVRLRCGARVAGIRTAAGEGGGQVVAGVTLASGEELDADVVVSNRDVPLTYELLRGPAETHGSAQARRLLAQDYSAGVIAYNWSLDRKLDQLLHHNVFLSGDFRGSWDRATSPDTLARSPNFYVHCPSRTDPTAAPPGADSVMVLLPVANIQQIVKAQEAERRRSGPLAALPGPLAAAAAAATGGGDSASASSAAAAAADVSYASLVAAGREAVLRSLAEAGVTDVRQHIVDELVIDPVEWRDRYSLAHGAAFGLSHGLTQLSVFRPGVADKQVRGLYLVGASTRPGNGVPLTMISADLVTQRVMQDVAAGVI